jgi:glycosyltransferase involved in cell wall biosynthesis
MTIWYDVTTTLRNRSRNGIAGVEWSLGVGLRELGADVRCFSLERGSLVEIELDRVFTAGAAWAPDRVVVPMASARRSEFRAIARDVLGASSVPVIKAMSAAYQRLARVRSAARRRVRGAMATVAPGVGIDTQVASGDVVVSMGADWDGDLARALSALRTARRCRVVTMVYDLIPLTHTHLAFHKDPAHFRRYFESLVSASDLITCISDQTRRDLSAFADQTLLELPPTRVLRLGDVDIAEEMKELGESDARVPREDFFLWVGTIERRKNLDLLYDALQLLERDGHDVPTVVIVGSRRWGVDDVLDEIGLQSTRASRALVFLGQVGDDELASLYRRARALLFPSHYEGWGLPIREAAVRGCPVATGDHPAVAESLVDWTGVEVLSTTDPSPWAEFMLRHADLPVTPIDAARPYTWAESSAALLAWCQELGQPGEPATRSGAEVPSPPSSLGSS